ncbi:MAG: 3,4-dihydroxy-2-butanone 4-phosphate synthase [delta proteobacterium ML8_D]|jgi:3,4-dihydroxy 2-butanone 4-phosphate synthase / GTP cyclohydrolase II|nr:MAG: 3,4-dihydroxy-2-butanone 4-phosphate synthase [delta proteobacterium ML8_D]
MSLSSIEEAIEDIQAGKMIILVDDEDRENEGDLAMAAETVTPEAINFMARYGRGLICLALTENQVNKLNLPMMTDRNTCRYGTAFTVSIEAKNGVTTGISAHDRATTIRTAIADESGPEDIVMPGHVFPLKAREGGVLVRAGQTEGSVDLARLAGLNPSGVICEIMKDDGSMARMPDLEIFARKHDLKIVTIADLIAYRLRTESFVRREVETRLPSRFGGEWKLIVYSSIIDPHEHLALVLGEREIRADEEILVRVHSECLTGDVLGSLRCDCGPQLQRAMSQIAKEGRGVLVYMRQEGRGIGLLNKLRAYCLQDQGRDTVEANCELGFKPDLRDYGVGAQILRDLGVRKMRLMTNNPKKIVGLEGYGMEMVERVPIEIPPHEENFGYLLCKKEKMGHLLHI